MNTSRAQMQVLVIGSGFAGATLAVRLAGRGRSRVAVTVVNPRPTFMNRLGMHQVATGQRIVAPRVDKLLGAGVNFIVGQVTRLDPDAGWAGIDTGHGEQRLHFDRVVFANGSRTETPALAGAELAHGVGDLEAAHRLHAALAGLPAGRLVSVVGGGFTGLETAAEIAERRPDLSLRLVSSAEAGSWFSVPGAAAVRRGLDELHVERLVDRVTAIEPGRLMVSGGSALPNDLTVWCGGFTANELARESGISVDAQGAVRTDGLLRSVSHPSVLAVGDAGATARPDGQRYSMSCQNAFPSAAHGADVLLAEAHDKAPFEAGEFSLGFIARCVSLGRRRAVLQRTNRADEAAGWALSGRSAVAAKRIQVRGLVTNIRLERRFPGAMSWLGAQRAMDSQTQ